MPLMPLSGALPLSSAVPLGGALPLSGAAPLSSVVAFGSAMRRVCRWPAANAEASSLRAVRRHALLQAPLIPHTSLVPAMIATCVYGSPALCARGEHRKRS